MISNNINKDKENQKIMSKAYAYLNSFDEERVNNFNNIK